MLVLDNEGDVIMVHEITLYIYNIIHEYDTLSISLKTILVTSVHLSTLHGCWVLVLYSSASTVGC